MGRSSVIIISITGLLQATLNSSAYGTMYSEHPEILSAARENLNSVQITDSWFFIAPKASDLYRKSFVRSNARLLKAGDRFGFRALFSTIKRSVNFRLALRVPSHPENFPSKVNGKVVSTISPDGRTVNVSADADGLNGSYAAYWGISDEDPEGDYQLDVFFENKLVGHFKFRFSKEPISASDSKWRD